ncbi:Piso0_004184 [Millerozyma farinosa CBS 7064]|uniref:Piso0_004184 protein n=1 Tax=Pichia sorbitophila (strain ATCC MYA-4447 / BCRC 22081 / CBS 7064 / NBRC 10061 / NRRL Y-12695) TaxID=559304 RepID=G8YAL8_PICSO|nr:Piso0_004184 [Millerozyma farinosa CBS 7064]CCE84632.1 Piso0_004184 [Millerozyma farinosa CBS 7064]
MSKGVRQTSLDNLAHIANMSHELQMLNQQLHDEASAETSNNKSGEKQARMHANDGKSIDSLRSSNANTPVSSERDRDNRLKGGRGKKMACVECRQQKSKCDAHEKHPNACTRCEKKGLQCDLRSDYKRTYKRARIAQIEKEFAELKKTLTPNQATELLKKVPSLYNNELLDISKQSADVQSPRFQGSQLYQPIHTANTNIKSASPSDPANLFQSPESSNSFHDSPSVPKLRESSIVTNSNASEHLSHPILHDELLQCEEKSLGDVTLSVEIIRALYKEYVNYYHPILPVVDIYKGPEKIYRLCPSLFWVIMFVSLRRFPEDTSKQLLLKLSPMIKDILAEISISPITRYNPTTEDEPILNACSVYSVQAFLLYTFWPPITSSLSADSSWNTIGVALFQAIRIGLHMPAQNNQTDNENQQNDMAQENAKTWIICNIASQIIATVFGFPAFVQFDTSIWSSCRPGSHIEIPVSVQYIMKIMHFEDQVAKALNSNPTDPFGLTDPVERLPLIKVLAKQLDELEVELAYKQEGDDKFIKFLLLSARVHLLIYYLMDSSKIAAFELQKGLVKLYNAAINLINFAEMCQARDKRFVKYLPAVYVLNIWQASCIVGKLIHSPLKSYIDIGSGKQSYQAAISLSAKASVLKHDISHRSSGIMRSMWSLFITLDKENMSTLSISIKTRMSASLFFECLYLLRERVGMIRLNTSNETQANEDSQENELNDAGSEEDEEYGYRESEAVVSDDDTSKDDHTTAGSQKSTPGSNSSSRTRKHRSLSNNANAESKARKIIQTIPLDPRPIHVKGKRSSIFKFVNNSSESNDSIKPKTSTSMSPSSAAESVQPYSKQNTTYVHPDTMLARKSKASSRSFDVTPFNSSSAATSSTNPYGRNEIDINSFFNDSTIQKNLDNIEINSLDLNSDILWKDVDSVMNDFGFHTQ